MKSRVLGGRSRIVRNGRHKKEVADRLRRIVHNRFHSQAEFARALDMMPQTFNQYLNGRSLPGNVIQERMRLLGIDVQWVMTGRSLEPREAPSITADDPSMVEGIASTLSLCFLVQKRYSLSKAAADLHIPKVELQAYAKGEKPIPISLLIRLANTTRDLELLKPLFAGTDIEPTLTNSTTKPSD